MIWNSFFSAFGGTAAALLICGYLGKVFIEHRLHKELKEFDNKLDSNAKQREITFTKLHNDRAETIKIIVPKCTLLVEVIEKYLMECFKSPKNGQLGNNAYEYWKEACNVQGEFIKYLSSVRYIFPQHVEEMLDNVIVASIDTFNNVIEIRQKLGWKNDIRTFNAGPAKELRDAINSLKLEFKKLVGVEDIC